VAPVLGATVVPPLVEPVGAVLVSGVVVVPLVNELDVELVEPTAVAVDGVTALVTVDCAATFGMLFGTWSASWTPPQPAIPAAARALTVNAAARREPNLRLELGMLRLRPDPYVARRSGSR
jgi:hypothetical protein